jgi:hypothetical protein
MLEFLAAHGYTLSREGEAVFFQRLFKSKIPHLLILAMAVPVAVFLVEILGVDFYVKLALYMLGTGTWFYVFRDIKQKERYSVRIAPDVEAIILEPATEFLQPLTILFASVKTVGMEARSSGGLFEDEPTHHVTRVVAHTDEGEITLFEFRSKSGKVAEEVGDLVKMIKELI